MRGYNHTLILYIGLGFIFLLYLRECNKDPNTVVETVTEVVTETLYDTIVRETLIPQTIEVEKIVTEVDTILDTVFIIQEFQSKNVYNRVLKDDSIAYIGLRDTVFQNQLLRGRLIYISRVPTTVNKTTHTTTLTPTKAKLFLGGYTGKTEEDFTAGVGVYLKTRQDYLFGINYGLGNTFLIHAYFKL
jgi:hypothetical protein